ncbi:Ankyrin repeat-containing protein [Erysiphe pulchra]|uniref:Ankyrin repeat-containing protein n=1 Tax=Erysiphe pulchra TaxID=225359 RepID=A0A2S4PSP0_9PEZI|nr:Ankyrin repeat-containing protein [Erysiphe pulchra]
MDDISPATVGHATIVEKSGFGSDFNIGLGESTKRPNTLPDDLPKSLDDRKFTSTYPLETEIYDAWKGQSEIIRLAAPARPLQYRSLSIDYGSKTPILKPIVNNHEQTNMLAAQAGHRDVFIDGDENAIANDNKLSDKEKKNTLQKSLNMAASNGDIDRIQRILNGKAREYVDIDAPDEEGTTPLIYASCFGHESVVNALLDAGAKANCQDQNQWSALMWAMINRHKRVAKALLDHGASVEVRSASGRTALDFLTPNSDLSEFLQDSGYNIGNVGVPDDFYNPGFSQDRFEEEMAENEMRRRMMMESARDLEVDIGNVGFDDQPETPEEHSEEAQEFDWNRCLHDQMFVFQENELGRILNVVITTMTPQRSSSQKPVPANILFLSARYAHYHANQDLLAKLLMTSLEKINDVVESHQWDMTILAFWISNATLLLHYLKKDGGLSESTKDFQFQLAELINEIFILIIRDAERRIDKTLDSSMLDHETIKGFEDIAFQHEWKIFKRKTQVKEEPAEKRFRPPSPKARSKPSPRNVTSLLSSTLFVLDLYDIHSVIISQILAQLLYWLGAELFNRIMSNRKYMARSKAMQIRMNVSMIEEWARSNNRQPEHYEDGSMTSSGESTIDAARNHLAPVIQLLQWLQCFSSLEQNDLEALTGTIQQLTRLTPQHLIHVVKHYRPEVGEKGLPKTGIKYLNKLQKEWQDRKDRLKNSRRTSSFSHVATSKMGNNNYRISQDSERIQHGRHNGSMAPAMSPIEEDDAPEGLFLDPAIMLPFTLPSGTDMLVSYGAGFGGLNREREHKYIPTISPEFLAKLDANDDKSRSRYAEKDWENEEE